MSRAVYLPRLGGGAVWRFTGAETDTTLGGVTIDEPTPLEGEDFGTFPVYMYLRAERA